MPSLPNSIHKKCTIGKHRFISLQTQYNCVYILKHNIIYWKRKKRCYRHAGMKNKSRERWWCQEETSKHCAMRRWRRGSTTGLRMSTWISQTSRQKSLKQENTGATVTGAFGLLLRGMVKQPSVSLREGKEATTHQQRNHNFQDLQLKFSCFLDHYKLFILEPQCQFTLCRVF